jgi:hypothetical protein
VCKHIRVTKTRLESERAKPVAVTSSLRPQHSRVKGAGVLQMSLDIKVAILCRETSDLTQEGLDT